VDKIGQNQGHETEGDAPASSPAGEVGLDSAALARLLDEVRNDTAFNPSAYNRTYNRHNR
jgi:hypothetical protein